MTTVRPFAAADRSRWDEYVRATPGSQFGQLIGWKELLEESFAVTPRYWIAERDGRVCGILPLFEKRWPRGTLFSVPGGLLAEDEEVAAALLVPALDQLRSGRLDYLELRDQLRAWPGLSSSDEHVTLVLELCPDPDAQWKAFDAKLRNQIRKGQRAGFTVRWGHDRVAQFHQVLLENMRDLGTPVRSRRYYQRALEKLGAAAEILVIEHGGAPAGAMFLVTHRDTAYDPWASSLRRYLADCPNQVLYWEALRWTMEHGLRFFDLGRSQRNSGTFNFKRQWGARVVQLYYQYALGRRRQIPTLADQKHSLGPAVRIWKRLPLPLADVLGERVRRLFPEVT